MSDMIYEIRDLRLSFPDMAHKPLFGAAPRVEVLKGLSFDVPKGEVLGIVGGSGSGKSTLGRAMIRLLEPDSGTIRFEGTDITHAEESALRPLRRKFQMIFQDPMSSLNPRRRVAGIIAGPLRLQGVQDTQSCVLEALDMVGLPRSFARRYPHELSGGQRQRVGIARAVALRPDFILADEIVSGLDVSSQAQVLNLLEQLVKDLGLTLAFISHDLSVIRRLCSRIIVMHRGEIVENAPTVQVFDAPQADYTRELLQSIPLPDPDQVWA
ncbi:ATP-binding cassette domain-containing protein [Lutimaribacter sp. EGI FJ00015]|uniref:ATP-binding cassette domain-containing protein n=1 Tax=Lutimaribacter degradans TaxID=2945989 RepID=A0ACC5ZYN7_9RHOB|nr:ABC transporter ATP-binding protein [Lutimaribacter sp. EGI FJ00013]MCM2562866.1 ATP-binding cassette domain-containing protein [Lutimaribacter sp. EGI FJ00013]MCO0614023.1 ATP-binding cassette domain-containing protein [Lutimaribacter sp. EGI FJ00015]MCO0636995.1 ATP-binding cassette domain-containing protein [Lutimaribacter sp. EGI FJ00014]